MSNRRLMGYLWIGAGLIIPILLIHYVKWNQVGPRAFWASDVCPAANVVCGNIPLVTAVAAIAGGVLIAAGHRLAFADVDGGDGADG